ncbi:MAG: nuclear transport factor 2 family protein [Pyrinomonadaceae bacterium]
MKHILGTLVLITGMFGVAFGECSVADKKALEAFDRDWGKATVAGDRAALAGMFADDFMGLPAGINKATSIDNAVNAAERARTNPNPDKVTHDHYYINCTPNSATITHRNVIWTPNGTGGKPETYYGRSVHILEKRGGKWQAVSNAGGGDLDDASTIWYLEQDWNNAFWKKDKAWFDANWAPDFSNVSSSDGALTGKSAEIASIVNDKNTYDLVETTGMDIDVVGNTARVTGVFHLKGKDDKGAPFDTRIRYTDTWVKHDGRWMAWSSQGTMMK